MSPLIWLDLHGRSLLELPIVGTSECGKGLRANAFNPVQSRSDGNMKPLQANRVAAAPAIDKAKQCNGGTCAVKAVNRFGGIGLSRIRKEAEPDDPHSIDQVDVPHAI